MRLALRLVAVMLCVSAGLTCACGKQATSLHPVAREAGAGAPLAGPDLAAPTNVDPALWNTLRTALRAELARRDKAALSAAVPGTPASRVNDLQAVPDDAGQAQLSWTYRNPGDYSQDGQVDAADLVTLAQYWGTASLSDDWVVASIADGNGDYRIDLRDVAAIGQYFGNTVHGYIIESAPSAEPGTAWAEVARCHFSAGQRRDNDKRWELRLSLGPQSAGTCFRVTPYYKPPAGAESPGLASNVAQFTGGSAGAGGWPSPNHDAQRTSRAGVNGPDSLRLRWYIESMGWTPSARFGSPVLGQDKTVYVVSNYYDLLAYSPGGALRWAVQHESNYVVGPELSADGTVFTLCGNATLGANLRATRPDGQCRWLAKLDGEMTALLAAGDLVYASTTLHTYCYSAAGDLQWQASTPSYGTGSLALDQQGNVILSVGQVLRKLSPAGSQLWRVDLPSFLCEQLVVRGDGSVLVPTETGLYAYSANGAQLWYCAALAQRVESLALLDDGSALLLSDPSKYDFSSQVELAQIAADGTLLSNNDLAFSNHRPGLIVDAAGRAYICDYSGRLKCLNADGSLRWSFGEDLSSIEDDDRINCALDDDGALYLASPVGLYCIAADGFGAPDPGPVSATDGAYYDHVRVSWQPMAHADSYYIYRSDQLEALAKTTDTFYDDYNIRDARHFTYEVAGVNVLGEGLRSSDSGRIKQHGHSDPGAGDWAAYAHDNRRTFCATVSGPLAPQIKWAYELPKQDSEDYTGMYAPVSGAGGTLYVASRYKGYLDALSPDGERLWRYQAGAQVSSPVVGADGTVYLGATKLVADVIHPPPPPPMPGGKGLSALSATPNTRVLAVKPDRIEHWRYEFGTWNVGTPPPVALSPDGAVLCVVDSRSVVRLTAQGVLSWRTDIADANDYFYRNLYNAPAVGPDGRLYVARQGGSSSDGAEIIALDVAGAMLWTLVRSWGVDDELGISKLPPAIDPAGQLYFSGTVAFSCTPLGDTAVIGPESTTLPPALSLDGRVYLATNGADSDSRLGYYKSGVFTWFPNVTEQLAGPILLDAADRAYISTCEGPGAPSVICLDPDGSQRWRLDLGTGNSAPDMSLGNDGTLFVAQDNMLWAIGEP